MGYGILAVPFLRAELEGHNVLRFDVGGGTLTATVTLPSYRYYNHTRAVDDFAAALAAALDAADSGGTWTYSWGSGGRLTLQRAVGGGGSPGTVQLRWTDGATTLQAAWLGFGLDNSANTSGGSGTGAITATYQGGRVWLPEWNTFPQWEPKRDLRLAASQSRVLSSRTLAQWSVLVPEFDALPCARIYQSAADDPDFAAALPVTAGDPNCALEALWEVMPGRLPWRWTPDREDLDTYRSVQIDPDADGEGFLKFLGEPFVARRGKDNYYRVRLPLMEYVSP